MSPGRGAGRRDQPARLRPDQQAALDLRRLQAAARPRHLRLRRARQPRLHAVPAVQLHRPEPRQRRGAEGRQLARVHAVPVQHHVPAAHQARGRRRAEALVHLHRRRHRVPAAHHREQGRLRHAPHLQHRQSRRTASPSGAGRAHDPHRAGVPARCASAPPPRTIEAVTLGEYYGKYYQDIQVRVPAIEAARESLGWEPTTDLR